MNDEDVIQRLRELPPDLAQPGDRTQQVRRRVRNRRFAIMGGGTAGLALVAAALVGGGFALRGNDGRTTQPAATIETCPAQYDGQAPWVPQDPYGIGGKASMVSGEVPQEAILCAYPGSNMDKVQTGWKLAGHRTLIGGLDRLADLRWLPRQLNSEHACRAAGGPQTNYLIGLTYAGGTEWVAATEDPNGCVGTSNGAFKSATNIGAQVTASYEAGAWVEAVARADGRTDGNPDPCWRARTGRLGQDSLLVPGHPVAAQICEGTVSETKADLNYRTWTARTGFDDLLGSLRALPTGKSDNSCQGDGRQAVFYSLLFTYAEGPPVAVRVDPHCSPSVNNGTLQANDASAVTQQIEALIAELG